MHQSFASPAQRRRLLEHDCLTGGHPLWGVLRSSRQLLAAHAPALTHWQRQDIVDHVEGAGARIMGYLPDDTLLLVGPPVALERAANHSHFVWAAPHEAEYKVAPEWGPLLSELAAIAAGVGPSGSNAASVSRSSRGVGGVVNVTQLKQAQVAAALAQLPVRVLHVVGEWPLVGIHAAFPAAYIPHPHAPEHPHAARHAARIERVRREQRETHAGEAAAAEWEPLLRDALGGGSGGGGAVQVQVLSGGPHAAIVFAPPERVVDAIAWLAARPAVHWVAPLPRHRVHNRQASCIAQAAKPAAGSGSDLDPSLHPVWAAGITGKNQVIGIGDSGIDRFHCFFYDPAVNWNSAITTVNGVQQFQSTTHRKIRMYRASSDFVDANGHGTHTSGTLAGIPYGTNLSGDGAVNVGMAPDAKLAFIDLSSQADGDSIITPYDLLNDYFVYTSAVGASIHSDSWGGSSIVYDDTSAQVDAYVWQNPGFLPVFPAGNDGSKPTGSGVGTSTVNSPATSKNCLAVGASQTSRETLDQSVATMYTVWTATAALGSSLSSTFPAVQATFGGSAGALGSAARFVAVASPLTACGLLAGSASLSGAVVLIERGDCTFEAKALAAQAAGAAAALVFDNVVGAYFAAEAGAQPATSPITIPTLTIPRRIGQNLLAVLNAGGAVNISFAASRAPANGFENLASFSSNGPVGADNRVKPDIVGVGTLASAAADTSGSGAASCDTVTYGGTSMATPVVAGSAALVRNYFEGGYYPSGSATPGDALEPSGSLLKAVLIGGAQTMGGYEAATGLPLDPPPSNRQGYGRVFLSQSLYLQSNPSSPARLQVVDAVPINTGDVHRYCVVGTGGPLSITLVWADYPGSPSSARSLVNDLDLTVRAEGLNGVPLLGNGGSISNSSLPDRVNNVEQVSLPAVPAGRVAIEVAGSSVQPNSGPQPYALVVNGAFNGTLTSPSASSSGAQCAVVVAVITSGPSGVTNATAPQFSFTTQSGSSQGVVFECRMADGGGVVGAPGTSDWQACTSPATYPSLPDGSYTFGVRAQGETSATSQSFLKDTVAPQTTLAARASAVEPAAPPPSPLPATTPQPTATFAFNASDATAVTYACQLAVSAPSAQQAQPSSGSLVAAPLQLGSWAACTSPQTVGWLLPGAWTFSVVATDAAGNAAQPATFAWTVAFDAAKQYARILTGPLLRVGKGGVNSSFAFAALSSAGGAVATLSGASTECAWVAGDASASPSTWASCASPAQFTAPRDGAYKFAARIVGDASLPASPDPDTWAVSTLIVDTSPPVATITSSPANAAAISASAVTISFNVSKDGSTAACSLSPTGGVAGAASPCSSPAQLQNLADGRYTFAVTPTDVVGNVGSPATTTFTVDTSPPNVTDLQVPVAITVGNLTATFTATDGPVGSGIKNVTCRVRPLAVTPAASALVNFTDAKWSWAPCSSPWAISGLVEGHWAAGVQATDNVNLSSGPVELEFWVDTTPPVVNLTGVPPANAVLSGGTATFNISDGSTPASVASSVGSPVRWQSLLQAITTDQYNAYRNRTLAGSGEGAGAAPPGSIVQYVRAENSSSGVAMSRPEAVQVEATTVVTLGTDSLGTWTNCSQVCTYAGLGAGAYTFQARGTDAAGNTGPTSAPYAFQASGERSSGLPTWALATIIAVGGVVLILAVAMVVCCCRRCRRSAPARPPAGAIAATTPAGGGAYGSHPPVYENGRPQQLYQYQSPYPYAANGGRGAGQPAYGGLRGAPAPGMSPPAHHEQLPPDPIEAQQLALALAASQHEARRGRGPGLAASLPPPAVTLSGEEQDAELRAAIEASLREQQRNAAAAAAITTAPAVGVDEDEDAQLRAALEASLRDQQHAADDEYGSAVIQSHWPSAPSPTASTLPPSLDWPPRR